MNYPSLQECRGLFEEYKVPGTVKTHCEAVHKAATFIAEELAKSRPAPGFKIDVELVSSFSLLHDFMKAVVLERLGDAPYYYTPTVEEKEMHQQLRQRFAGKSETKAAFLLLNKKYPQFAALFLELDELTRNPNAAASDEARLVHYIDWRILGNKIVPLQERMKYIYQKYKEWIIKNNLNWPEMVKDQEEYERKLFNQLPFNSDDLQNYVKI
ncbi:hypothetical protein HZC30_04370 [Candidatus Woesearchaeota archaeon]|nr:hypothetical protein [Candidatus Woesearchaeota archaeon]